MIKLTSGDFPLQVGFIKDNVKFHIRPTMAFGGVFIYIDVIYNQDKEVTQKNIIETIELPTPDATVFDSSTGNAYYFIIDKLMQYALGWLQTNYTNCTFEIE